VSLPTPAKQNEVVQQLVGQAQALIASNLGFNLDASQIAAVLEVAVDSLCMKAWKQAHAAGTAAAATITTEDAAEASQRKP
jgi:hypothetical protein